MAGEDANDDDKNSVPGSSPGEGQGEETQPDQTGETNADPDTKSKDSKEPSPREELIKRLTEGDQQTDEEDEESEPEETGEGEQSESEGEGGPDQSEKPERKDDEELPDHIPDTEWAKLGRKTKKRIHQFREKIKRFNEEREPLAQYGENILKFVSDQKLDPDDFGQWVELGAVVNRGGEQAVNALLTVAKNLGWKGEADDSKRESRQDEGLPDWLQEKVDNLELDAKTAEEINRRLTSTKPEPAPKQPEPAQPSGIFPRQERDPQQELQAQAQKASETLRELDAKGAEEYPADWPRLREEIKTEMAKFAGADPSQWGTIFEQSKRLVLAKHTGKKSDKGGMAPGAPSRSKGFDELTGRKRAIAGLTTGKIR